MKALKVYNSFWGDFWGETIIAPLPDSRYVQPIWVKDPNYKAPTAQSIIDEVRKTYGDYWVDEAFKD